MASVLSRIPKKPESQALMYGFYWLFKATALLSPEFKERIADKRVHFQMKIKDDTPHRYYTFDHGKVRSRLSSSEKTDFVLIWKSVEDGNKVMVRIVRQKPKALMNAVIAGELLLEGDAALIGWFLETLNQVTRFYKHLPRNLKARFAGS